MDNRRPALSRCAVLTLLVGVVLQSVRAADPPRPPTKPPATPPTVRTLDEFKKLPPGAVLVIIKDFEEGRKLVPGGVFLDPDEYLKLVEENKDLKARLAGEQPAPPAECHLSGVVEGNLAQLKARFEFVTERANQVVPLGCALASPTAVKLDDQLPILQPTDEGFFALVEKPGTHTLTLEMEVPLGTEASERTLTLDLPRSPVTRLELDLPEAVREVKLSTSGSTRPPRGPGQTFNLRNGDKHGRLDAGAIGPVAQFKLQWKGQAATPTGPPLLLADTQVTVRVGEPSVVTDVKFTLTPRGQTSQWRLWLPPQARLVNPAAPDERVTSIETPEPKQPWLRIVKLNRSTDAPLELNFQIHQPRTDNVVNVGPFLVPGAFQQQGNVLITAPPEVRLNVEPRGQSQVLLASRDVTPEERRREPRAVAAYRYWLPAADKGSLPPSPSPLLGLEIESTQGQVATRSTHTLRLSDGSWYLVSDVQVIPLRVAGVDQVVLQLPTGFEPDVRVGDVRQKLEIDANRQAVIAFAAKKAEPFTLRIEGRITPEMGSGLRAAFDLPTVRRSIDRGGQMTVQVPREFELLNPRPGDPAWTSLTPGRAEFTWQTDRGLDRAEVAWQPYRVEVVVPVEAYVTFSPQQLHVEQRLRLPRTEPSTQVLLWVPEDVPSDRVRVLARGRPAPTDEGVTVERPGFRPWLVSLTELVDREHPLIVRLFVPLPVGEKRRFATPLVVPDLATRVEATVQVWGLPGDLPMLAGGPWEEERPRAVSDRGDSVPALALVGTRLDQPPVLRLADTPTLPSVHVERTLIRAAVADSGYQTYRVWFLLRRLVGPHLDVELPAPLPAVDLRAALRPEGGSAMTLTPDAVEEGRTARLRLPAEAAHGLSMLELTYRLPGRGGPLHTVLSPPVLRGEGERGPVRWQVTLPPTLVPLPLDADLEQRWGWRGWLLAPRSALGDAALEQWFFAGTELGGDLTPATAGTQSSGLVCWGGFTPLRIVYAPQQAWLLLCSLTLLILGLALYFLSPSSRLFWPVVVLLTAVVGTTVLLWPGVLSAVVYGCEPGVLVLLLVLGIPWMLHQRYRRQVVFMPGFTRVRAGSSLIRNGGSGSGQRPRGEPSTVDVPGASAGG